VVHGRRLGASRAPDQHAQNVDEQERSPCEAEPREMNPWVSQLLDKPEAAVHRGKQSPVETEIHHPLEVSVGQVGAIGGAVLAARPGVLAVSLMNIPPSWPVPFRQGGPEALAVDGGAGHGVR